MVRRDTNSVEFIYCGCGCGKTRSKYNKNGRESKYINGHNWKGKKHTETTKQKMKELGKGENNANWKADNISMWGLHKWLRENISKPKLCPMCKQKPPRDMANITGFYNRDVQNWTWLCVRCHKYFDNIIERNLTMKGKYMYRDSKTGRFMRKSQ